MDAKKVGGVRVTIEYAKSHQRSFVMAGLTVEYVKSRLAALCRNKGNMVVPTDRGDIKLDGSKITNFTVTKA